MNTASNIVFIWLVYKSRTLIVIYRVVQKSDTPVLILR